MVELRGYKVLIRMHATEGWLAVQLDQLKTGHLKRYLLACCISGYEVTVVQKVTLGLPSLSHSTP